eukprot:scaffold2910_cov390-Prasinococcus_capsulatus_cf.AAC.57
MSHPWVAPGAKAVEKGRSSGLGHIPKSASFTSGFAPQTSMRTLSALMSEAGSVQAHRDALVEQFATEQSQEAREGNTPKWTMFFECK